MKWKYINKVSTCSHLNINIYIEIYVWTVQMLSNFTFGKLVVKTCIIYMKEFISLTMVVMEIGKRHVCCKEKKLDQKLESYRFKLPLQKLGWLNQYRVR